MTERSQIVEIALSSGAGIIAFSANGECVLGGGWGANHFEASVGVRDGQRAAPRMVADGVTCIAVSQDGKWIATGSVWGFAFVWDTTTHRRVPAHRADRSYILAVDFSPDSMRLVTASENGTATLCDLVPRRQVRARIYHEHPVVAAKYSPRGERITTATPHSVRIWDSNDGSLLVDIKVEVYGNGLLWSDNHLFVVSSNTIKELDASAGSTVSAWPVSETNKSSCIALTKHGEFIAYSVNHTVTFRDLSTHTVLSCTHPQKICSIAFSPCGRFFAIGLDKKIIVESLSSVAASVREEGQLDERPARRNDDDLPSEVPSIADLVPSSSFSEPVFQVDDAVLDLWRQDRLADAEALLAEAITVSQNQSVIALTSRALLRARRRNWAMALADAELAIKIQPTIIAYVAKSMAHVGDGQKIKGYRACDIAFRYLQSSHVTFLLLVKAIIVFLAGEHADAIARMADLIATAPSNSVCYVVQAYMHLVVGNLHSQSGNYEGALQSFEQAQAQVRPLEGQSTLLVSLISGWKFEDLYITIRQRMCEAMDAAGHTVEAVQCFCQLANELEEEVNLPHERREWVLAFKQRLFEELERLGDATADAHRHEEAISRYSIALSLNHNFPRDILIKRSRAYLAVGSWELALEDANQAILLDPSSPWGYETKHSALHSAGDYGSAVGAFEAMLSRITESPDPDVQRESHPFAMEMKCSHNYTGLGDQYVSPASTRATIRKIVQRTIRHSPRELIDTRNGRIYSRTQREAAFESLPVFNELVSSMTRRIGYVRIKREVREYFRYVMLSHKWETDEPLYQQVVHAAVYNLDQSPTHDKLKTFCEVVRDAGFIWAWSDTCCINKSDHFVLQEALVAMFKWYEGSALTIVYLRGVHSLSLLGALVRSIWNTRAWTLQEYVAAKVVRFYTEDWTPYLGLQSLNHKESQEIITEMEEATGVSAQQLMALRPGLSSIREKLRLASNRQTTLVEDTAYSLLGIFSVTGISAIYGEEEGALGRLLANLLTRSGDASVLAWTGQSGPFNSCLPAHITVFDGPATSHLPEPIPDTEMEAVLTGRHVPSFDLDAALRLYRRLSDLALPRFAESRMTLPCIAIRLSRLSSSRDGQFRVYLADTDAFGEVEIRTRQDLSRMGTLYLVHPWLESIHEHEDVQGGAFEEDDVVAHPWSNMGDEIDEGEIDDEVVNPSSLPEPEPQAIHRPSDEMTPMDRELRARRLIARLRQPFGALLLTLMAAGRRVVGYKRVAADSTINVRFLESFSLTEILENVRNFDVL